MSFISLHHHAWHLELIVSMSSLLFYWVLLFINLQWSASVSCIPQSSFSCKFAKTSLLINPTGSFLFSSLNFLRCLPLVTTSSLNLFYWIPWYHISLVFLNQYTCFLSLVFRGSFHLPASKWILSSTELLLFLKRYK